MEAELLKELNEKDTASVTELVCACNEADHTNYDTDLDGDFYYLVRNDDKEESGLDSELFAVLSGYLLGETIDGKQVLEIEAFTHPVMRGIGLFSMCYNSLKDDFRGYHIKFMIKRPLYGFDREFDTIKSVFPFVSPDTYETLSAIGAVHLTDELLMEKTLTRGISDPGDELCNKYGEVHLTGYDKETLYLYGLLVYDSYLGQGHGRRLMEDVEAFKSGKYKKILLQVADDNVIAKKLYEKIGYKEIERIVYFLDKNN